MIRHTRCFFKDDIRVVPSLLTYLDAEQLGRMRRTVQIAERVAPTHPHPGVESQVANILAGPFVAMIDRVRDLFTGQGGGDT